MTAILLILNIAFTFLFGAFFANFYYRRKRGLPDDGPFVMLIVMFTVIILSSTGLAFG